MERSHLAKRYSSPWITAVDNIGRILFKLRWRLRTGHPEPERALVVCVDDIPQVIQTLPAVQLLKREYPAVRIDYLTGSWARRLLEGHPDISDTLVYNAPWIVRNFHVSEIPSDIQAFQKGWSLRHRQYDTLLSFQADFFINVLAFATRCITRVGYQSGGGGFLLTHPFDLDLEVPAWKSHMELLSVFGIHSQRIIPVISPLEDDLASAQSIIEGLFPKRPFAVVYPGGNQPELRWNPENFRNIMEVFVEDGYQVLLIGCPGGTAFLNEICRDLKVEMVQVWNFPTPGEIAALGRQAALFLGVHSGAAHIMAAMNTPSIVLMGSHHAGRLSPLGKNAHLVFSPEPCASCASLEQESGNCTCIENISLEQVLRVYKNISQ